VLYAGDELIGLWDSYIGCCSRCAVVVMRDHLPARRHCDHYDLLGLLITDQQLHPKNPRSLVRQRLGFTSQRQPPRQWNLKGGLIMAFPGLSRPMRANERRCFPAAPREHQPTPLGKAHQQIEDALTAFEDRLSPILGGLQSGAITPEGRSQSAASGSYKRPRLLDPSKYDPDARGVEPVR
jgi:hypothetical protein